MIMRGVQRTVAVFDCFTPQRMSLTLQEIADSISLAKSTTFRIVQSLEEAGYLIRLDDQKYCLSFRFTRLAGMVMSTLSIRQVARPLMQALANEGVSYNQFHVTALCDPTRAAILTGRSYASSALLAADPQRFPEGTMLSFQTVSQREAEVWQFAVEKTETLSLPYGNVPAVKLNRKPRREFDQQIEIWFAPQLQYLPVRLRITSANGDQIDQLLRALDRP